MRKLSMLYGLAVMLSAENTAGIDLDNTKGSSNLKPLKDRKPIKEVIPKGLKEFCYGRYSIYAINQKNADKKARKRGYI